MAQNDLFLLHNVPNILCKKDEIPAKTIVTVLDFTNSYNKWNMWLHKKQTVGSCLSSYK